MLKLLIGFSRPYLGVHSPTDVLGGFVLAGPWLAVVFTGAKALGRSSMSRARRTQRAGGT